jgi:c-di-GMP-binding flagellar brake protein YcgR
MVTHDSERREFVRVRANLSVRYKFLSRSGEDMTGEVHQGMTHNIGGGGLLLEGKIPDLGWIPDLLMQKVVVGVNVDLPDSREAVKALTRVAWVESVEEGTGKCAIGLMFKEITREHQDRIFKYVIKAQMPS